jgi:alkylated DNA repair dioxygenase AlkB|tara:strand:+ start:47 stop:604 length:558 start_codon:yes stop_codon:yes gene_type:complete
MKEKYKYVKDFISLDICDFLTTYSYKIKSVLQGDDQIPQSHTEHSTTNILYAHLLDCCLDKMEKETQLKLKPTYCYNRIYLPGANLEKHTDREACEISASITLNYSYANLSYKWPLCMGEKPIIIEKGDAVIYKGCEIEHWRPVFNEENPSWHHQAFIHYIDLNGPYKDYEENKWLDNLKKFRNN